MFGMSCYLSSLTNAKDNPILHYRMVTISFHKYITITRRAIVAQPIESGCVHLLPSLANKLVHFGPLSDSGRRERPAKGEIG